MAGKSSYLMEKVKGELQGMITQGILRRGGLVPSDRELARTLGASPATVQRAIQSLASEGKVVRIPSKGTVVAEDVSVRSSRQIWAVLVRDLQYFYPPLVEKIEREAHKLGVTIVLKCIGGDLEAERQMIHQTIAGGVSGIILAPVQPLGPPPLDCQNPIAVMRPEGSLDYLAELPVPVVLIDHVGMDMPNIGIDCVLKDDFAGAYQSVAHLVQHGYQKIAYFHSLAPGQTSQPYEAVQREKGFQAALDDYGLSLPELPELLVWHIDHDTSVIKEYLDAGVEAFVLGDDGTAAIFIRLLEESWGVKVPNDVAVMGFDDDRICMLTNPTITSIRAPKKEMAQKAVQFLHDRIKTGSRGNYRSIILKPTVIPRTSCGKNCPLTRSLIGSAILVS